jgi:hypothetical protein
VIRVGVGGLWLSVEDYDYFDNPESFRKDINYGGSVEKGNVTDCKVMIKSKGSN